MMQFKKPLMKAFLMNLSSGLLNRIKVLNGLITIGKVEKDVNGNVFRLYGTVQDINERKRVEEALQKSDLLLRTILNNAPITIFATDRQGVFTLSDGNELKSVGLKPGENVGSIRLRSL